MRIALIHHSKARQVEHCNLIVNLQCFKKMEDAIPKIEYRMSFKTAVHTGMRYMELLGFKESIQRTLRLEAPERHGNHGSLNQDIPYQRYWLPRDMI